MVHIHLTELFIGLFTNGWVTIERDDPRFVAHSPALTSEGDQTKKPSRWFSNRKRWNKILVMEVVGSGFIGCTTFTGKTMICLAHRFGMGQQVAVRIGKEPADFILFVPDWEPYGYPPQPFLRERGYVVESDLSREFPHATLI